VIQVGLSKLSGVGESAHHPSRGASVPSKPQREGWAIVHLDVDAGTLERHDLAPSPDARRVRLGFEGPLE